MKPIVQEGDEVLRAIALPVEKAAFGTPELRDLIREMEEALAAEPDGVALAAPQIGVQKRVFIVRYDRMLPPGVEGEMRAPDVGVYINPEIVKKSRKRSSMDEGCLSVRGTYGTTKRYERATVRAYDVEGALFERGGGGIVAQAFQHEIDHLNGILFIDHAHDMYHPKESDHA